MRIGLLPGSVSGAGGPSTYVSQVVRGLAHVAPHTEVRTLLLGTRLATPAGRRERRQTAEMVGRDVATVRLRPVSPRLYASRRSAGLLPSYDHLFGRHDIYHQTHLDLDPKVPDHKLVLTVHDLIAENWPDEGTLIAGAAGLLSRAAHIITVSRASRDVILARFPDLSPDRLHVSWNGVDHKRFNERPAQDDARWLRELGIEGEFLLYMGGLSRRKNVDVLLRAYASAQSGSTEFPQLVLIGPWSADQIPQPVPDRVRVCGSVAPSAVPALLRRAEALVLPSREEGFGLPLLEAQACGTPVICSDIPVFQEIGGAAAVFVDSRSPSALSVGLAEALLRIKRELATLRSEGLRHSSQFTWERSAQVHAHVYRLVAARDAPLAVRDADRA